MEEKVKTEIFKGMTCLEAPEKFSTVPLLFHNYLFKTIGKKQSQTIPFGFYV